MGPEMDPQSVEIKLPKGTPDVSKITKNQKIAILEPKGLFCLKTDLVFKTISGSGEIMKKTENPYFSSEPEGGNRSSSSLF